MSRTYKVNVGVTLVGVVVLASGPTLGVDANDVANYALLAGSATAAVFTVLYGTRSRWTLFAAGRSLLYVSTMLALTLAHIALVRFFGQQYPGRGVVSFVLYYGTAGVLLNMLLTLLRIQQARGRGEHPNGDIERTSK